MIFCLRQLQEKCIEQDRPLYMVFVDFSKAFDTVGRTGLWQLLSKYGSPEKFITMIATLHTGLMAEKSRNRSVLQMGSMKVVYWPPHSSPSSYQQCSTRLSETWVMAHHRVQTERWPIQRHTLQSEDQYYSDERAAIRRWQCTGCTLCWKDAENSGCFLRCFKEVRPED